MDNYKPDFLDLNLERFSNIAVANEKKWLLEYVRELKNEKYWDIDFIEYRCYRVFVLEYHKDINHYRDDFIKKGGSISFEDASWGLYFIATKQEHRIIKSNAEA